MIDAHTVQFRLKFDFALFIYHSLNFYQFLKKSFFDYVNGDVVQNFSKILHFLNLCMLKMHV